MDEEILLIDAGFPEILKQEAEKVVGVSLELGEKFKSADSFSYLLNSKTEKYVGKIH